MIATLLILNILLALTATAMGGAACPDHEAPPPDSSSVTNTPLLDTFSDDRLDLFDNDGDESMRVRISKLCVT